MQPRLLTAFVADLSADTRFALAMLAGRVYVLLFGDTDLF